MPEAHLHLASLLPLSCDQRMSHCNAWPSLEMEKPSLDSHSELSSCHNGYFWPWPDESPGDTCKHFSMLWIWITACSGSGGCSGLWQVWCLKVGVRKAQDLQRNLWFMGRSILHPTALHFAVCICPPSPAPARKLSFSCNSDLQVLGR